MSNEELVAVIQAGAEERMGELWERVKGFVILKARRIPLEDRADCEFDDLLQSGYLAVAGAVADYKPGNHKFLTHLGYHLKVQFAIATRFRSLRQQRETLTGTVSLDAPVSGDTNASTLAYFQEDSGGVEALESAEEQIFQAQLREAVAAVLADLPEAQRELLRLRFWKDATLQEIATIQGTTPERIRQKENRVLRELRKPKNAARLVHFIDLDYYNGASLSAFKSSGYSIQERYLIKQDRIRERQAKQKTQVETQTILAQIEEDVAQRVARMLPEEKRALLEKYGYA